MKKILLTTTAISMLAGAAYAGSSTAKTGGPTVTVGGYADFQIGNASQESLYEAQTAGNVYSRDTHTRTDTEVHIDVKGRTDNGLLYGAHIELEADVSRDDSTSTDNNAEKTYIFVESGFGRVELGTNVDAGYALRVNAASFARATGGIGGDFYKYVSLSGSSKAAGDTFYIKPGLPTGTGLPSETGAGTSAARATANKITYYTPRIQGAQLGVSYTPDQSERGTKTGFSGEADGATEGAFEDVWNIGLNYQAQVSDVNIEASITGEWGSIEQNASVASVNDDLEAYAFGASANYAGFTVGGSYGIADEFGQTTTTNQQADYWTLGAAYEFGPFAASVGYLSSEIENGTTAGTDAEFSNLSVGADYQLAPGLVPYIEVSFFETDNNTADTATTVDNEGTVIILGTELNF